LNNEQTRINHLGGSLPLIFAVLEALGPLLLGETAVATSVINIKHKSTEEAETKRHNEEIERIAESVKILIIGSDLKKTKLVTRLDLTVNQV
jgi:hypothetical protein